jgi:tRNA G18 (ribose-2'-O)-methylase SpoU
MGIERVESLDDPRIALYRNLKDRDLRERHEAFIVEGRGSLEMLLDRSPFEPESLLLSDRACRSLADRITKLPDPLPVYVASRTLMAGIVGFDMYRGVLALCRREREPTFEETFDPGRFTTPWPAPVIVLEALANHDNVGAIFRNAQAFGVPAIALCPRTCDPLYRKAIRTSMGATLCVPFVRTDSWPEPLARLRALGFTVAALHPDEHAVALAASGAHIGSGPLALVVGTEGPGISDAALAECDLRIRIPIAEGIDSINVATAGAIALHHFREHAAASVANDGSV